jgi:phage terminase large subunit-like protein
VSVAGKLADRFEEHPYHPRDWYCALRECDGEPHKGFPSKHARTAQRLPDDLPRAIYWRGGRGSGKTRSATQAFASLIVDHFDQPLEWGVVAPTAGDARTVCMESVKSGLLMALGAKVSAGGTVLDEGPYIDRYQKTTATIYLKSGGVVFSDGADDGALRIQGKNLSGILADEVGLWKSWKTAWNESIRYAVRIPPAKLIICGTPKRTMPARELVKLLLADDVSLGGRTVNRQLLTKDNAANLDEETLAAFLASMGTALERQELEGDLIDDIDGALWRIKNIDEHRLVLASDDPQEIFDAVDPRRVVISIDPAVTANEDSDETGIIVCAKGADGRGFVLEDLSGVYRPEDWPPVVIEACERWLVDRVVAEVNNGGDYIGTVLKAAGYKGAYETVRATRGKEIRAEPVAMAYQKGRGVHVGYFPELEHQQTSWVPGRVDALVWGFTYLGVVLSSSWGILYTPVEKLDIGEPDPLARRSSWGNVYKPKEKDAQSDTA